MCRFLGLPYRLSYSAQYHQYFWPTKFYQALYDHQIMRGFDPLTTDFAQSLGFQIFDIVAPKNHFQEKTQMVATKHSRSSGLFSWFIQRIKHLSCTNP
ncbi:hypothetical protein L218DRAFT_910443, partial [Marasmius fiardii PR-910]